MNIETLVLENTWCERNRFFDHGWGNGYVGVRKNHPWYGLNYDMIDANVHGGLTYSSHYRPGTKQETSDVWWIGFDTAHFGDTLESCSKEYVERQTEKLRLQAELVLRMENQIYGND